VPKLKVSIVLKTPIDDLVVHGRYVYALSRAGQRLFAVDSRSSKVTRRWRLRVSPHSLAVGGGYLYVDFDAAVEQISLASGASRYAKLPGSSGPSQDQSIAAEAGAAWLLTTDRLYRVDADTLRVTRSIAAPVSDDVWVGDGSLWLASEQPNGGVHRLDPLTGKEIAHDSADAVQLAFSPGVVWAAAAAGPTALDARSAKRVAALPSRQVASQGSAGIATTGDTLWVTYGDIGRLQEIRITR